MSEGKLFTKGLKDKKVLLTKIENVIGGTSKVSIGRKKHLILTQEIVVGFPLMKKRLTRHRDEAPRSIPATSTIREVVVTDKENGFYKFKTDNSVYELEIQVV